jgi:hypothetical protein
MIEMIAHNDLGNQTNKINMSLNAPRVDQQTGPSLPFPQHRRNVLLCESKIENKRDKRDGKVAARRQPGRYPVQRYRIGERKKVV